MVKDEVVIQAVDDGTSLKVEIREKKPQCKSRLLQVTQRFLTEEEAKVIVETTECAFAAGYRYATNRIAARLKTDLWEDEEEK